MHTKSVHTITYVCIKLRTQSIQAYGLKERAISDENNRVRTQSIQTYGLKVLFPVADVINRKQKQSTQA